jgi:hypothetical protein
MSPLNKLLSMLLIPAMAYIGYRIAESASGKSAVARANSPAIAVQNKILAAAKPKELLGALGAYRNRIQNPLGVSNAKDSAPQIPTDADMNDLQKFLATNKNKAQAQADLDASMDALMEDDGYIKPGQQATARPGVQAKPSERKPSSQGIEFDGASGFAPSAEDKIRALNVPENVRKAILDNYERTGVLPAIFDQATQQDR